MFFENPAPILKSYTNMQHYRTESNRDYMWRDILALKIGAGCKLFLNSHSLVKKN